MTAHTTSLGTLLLITCLGSAVANAQDYVGWIDKGDDWPDSKARLQAFGEQFDTAGDLYRFLYDQADGGDKLDWPDMAKPAYDWSGIFTRTGGGPCVEK